MYSIICDAFLKSCYSFKEIVKLNILLKRFVIASPINPLTEFHETL